MPIPVTIDGQTYQIPLNREKNWGGATTSLLQAIVTALEASLRLSGGTLTGTLVLAGAPAQDLEAATKLYVDQSLVGIQSKDAARAATASAGTLATDFEDGDTLDGVVLATGDRILIKDQADPAENGIYVVQASGSPVRSGDADSYAELFQAFVFVTEGTVNASRSYLSGTPSSGTIDVDPVSFNLFGVSSVTTDGEGIEVSGSEVSLELDGATLSKSATGLKVADQGLADAQVAPSAAIARSKLAAGTPNRLIHSAPSTGLITDLAAITGSRALVSDGNGLPLGSSVTTTELNRLSGLTSPVQTQLDAKLESSDVLGTETILDLPASRFRAKLTGGPTVGSVDGGANKPDQNGWNFTNGVNQYIETTLYMPKRWNGQLSVRFFWKNFFGSGNVVWAWAGIAEGDNQDVSSLSYSNATVVDSSAATSIMRVSAFTGYLTPLGTPAYGKALNLRIGRNGGSGSDTLGFAVLLTGVQILYQANALNDE